MNIAEWFKNAYGSYWEDRPNEQSWNKSQLEAMYECAYKEGMLAAADIAGSQKIYSAPNWNDACQWVEAKIREAAK